MSGLSLRKPRARTSVCLRLFFGALLLLGQSGMLMAIEPEELLEDPVLEARARVLSAGLRCLVCQNQSIDDSDAELARDLRKLVREQILTGKSDDEITAYLISRYGDFVVLRPPFRLSTLFLWFTPLLLIVLAFVMIFRYNRARRTEFHHESAPLTEQEMAELSRLNQEE